MSPPTNSSRWSPTPEQLMMLEEIYSSGIRTPNAFQIQQITARLSFHGRIEPKNVFYWFQNHKARERQKLRRKLCRQLPPQRLYLSRQLDQHNRGILRCLEPSSSIETRPFFCNSNGSLLQVLFTKSNDFNGFGGVQGVEKTLIIPGRVEMEKAVTRMYGYDWMMMKVSVGQPHPDGPTKPPKTLQLFPITSSNLKDDEFATST